METKHYEVTTPADLQGGIEWLASIQLMLSLAIPRAEWNPTTQDIGAVAFHFAGDVLSEQEHVLRIGAPSVTCDFALTALQVYKKGMEQGIPIPVRTLTIVLPA